MTSTIICFFTLKFSIGTSRKGDEDRDWKHSTSSCRQKPLSRLIFKRRTDAANRELDVNQRWLTGQGHFRGQSDFNWGRCPSGPTPRSAPGVDASLAPLRLQGIRILNYVDDWLILAHSEQIAVRHRDVVLAQMKELGLRLNAKKSVLSPLQRTT